MSIDISKVPPAPWYVNYHEDVNDCGQGPAGFSIGPYEEDMADSFAFSDTVDATGNNKQIEAAFEFIVLARSAFDFYYKQCPNSAMLWLTNTEKWFRLMNEEGLIDENSSHTL